MVQFTNFFIVPGLKAISPIIPKTNCSNTNTKVYRFYCLITSACEEKVQKKFVSISHTSQKRHNCGDPPTPPLTPVLACCKTDAWLQFALGAAHDVKTRYGAVNANDDSRLVGFLVEKPVGQKQQCSVCKIPQNSTDCTVEQRFFLIDRLQRELKAVKKTSWSGSSSTNIRHFATTPQLCTTVQPPSLAPPALARY